MAWPDDARYVNYAANQMVKSAELNEFQDQIYANHANINDLLTDVTALTKEMAIDFLTPFEVGTQDQLTMSVSGGTVVQWKFSATGAYYFYEMIIPTQDVGSPSVILSDVIAKVYNAHGSNQDWTLEVLKMELEMGASILAVSGSQIATQTTSIGTTAYGTISCMSIDETIYHSTKLIAVVGPTYHVDDVCYGVRARYLPIGA